MSRTKIPLAAGNIIGVLGTGFAFYLTAVAADIASVSLSFVIYLISIICLVFFPHCLAHFIVGRLVRIRFTHYSLGRSGIAKMRMPGISALASKAPLLTLRIDKTSLKSASRGARAAMFASGALSSMILPFFVPVASLRHIPTSLTVGLAFLCGANVVFDLYYSPIAGDLSNIKDRL